MEILLLSFELMLLGMGFVFVFLTLLVFATSQMSRLVMKYFPEPQVVSPPPVAAPQRGNAGTPDPTTLAVIAAAIKQYRSKR